MDLLKLILTSGTIVGLMGATLFFAKEEPYKVEIVLSSIVRNILVGLLICLTVSIHHIFERWSMLELVAWGALYGFLIILVVFLSKGRESLWIIFR